MEINLLSSLLAALANQASSFLTTGVSPGRKGNEHPSVAPYELLPCKDGSIVIACGNDTQFRKLAVVLGDESLAGDERFATNAARVHNRPAMVDALVALLARDRTDVWTAKLLAVGVPAGKVGTIEDAFALATKLGLEPTVDVGEGRPAQVRNPIRYSDTPITRYSAPPRLGEHSVAVRALLQEETTT